MYAQSSLRKHHLNYFNHVLELFKPYLSKDFIVKEKHFTDKRTNANYSSVQFATLTLPCFNYYRDLFYNSENLKIVPSNIKNLYIVRYPGLISPGDLTMNSHRISLLGNG
jgi:hypothetical protein